MNTEYKHSASLFNYNEAFKRNLGLISQKEQELLKNKTVAIPGLGGVGGAHLLTLIRMGVGGFHLADQDTFQLANFNRQYGAKMSTLDNNKADVMAREALDINPNLRLQIWKTFIDENSIDEFLKGVDLVIDSLDYYAIEARELLYSKARMLGIPVITAGPLGFSCALMTFVPDGMSFHEYFDLKATQSHEEKLLRFTLGLSPRLLWLKYMDMAQVDKDERTGPSSAAAIALCAGMAAIEAVKLLLDKKTVKAAPTSYVFDSFLMKFRKTTLVFGNKGLIQRLKLWIAGKVMLQKTAGNEVQPVNLLDRFILKDEVEALETSEIPLERKQGLVDSLTRVNDVSGYHGHFVRQLERLINSLPNRGSETLRILDIGPGGGGLLRAIHQWSEKKGIQVELFGVDLNPGFAAQTMYRLRNQGVPVTIFQGDASNLVKVQDGEFDIVISSYMVHHIRTTREVGLMMKEVHRVAKRGWLILDLDRRARGLLFMWLGLFVGEPILLIQDGLKSLRRAYRSSEMNAILKNHGLGTKMKCRSYKLFPHWRLMGRK